MSYTYQIMKISVVKSNCKCIALRIAYNENRLSISKLTLPTISKISFLQTNITEFTAAHNWKFTAIEFIREFKS